MGYSPLRKHRSIMDSPLDCSFFLVIFTPSSMWLSTDCRYLLQYGALHILQEQPDLSWSSHGSSMAAGNLYSSAWTIFSPPFFTNFGYFCRVIFVTFFFSLLCLTGAPQHFFTISYVDTEVSTDLLIDSAVASGGFVSV